MFRKVKNISLCNTVICGPTNCKTSIEKNRLLKSVRLSKIPINPWILWILSFFLYGPPKVLRTIPDLSEKVSIVIEDIQIGFSEPMMGVDIAYASVPIGDLKWIDGGRTLVIPFSRPLLPSKTYRLILAEGYRNMAGVAFPEVYTHFHNRRSRTCYTYFCGHNACLCNRY